MLAIDRVYICEQIGKAGQQPAGLCINGLSDADPTKEFREVGGDYYDPYDYEGNLEEASNYWLMQDIPMVKEYLPWNISIMRIPGIC